MAGPEGLVLRGIDGALHGWVLADAAGGRDRRRALLTASQVTRGGCHGRR